MRTVPRGRRKREGRTAKGAKCIAERGEEWRKTTELAFEAERRKKEDAKRTDVGCKRSWTIENAAE